MLARCKDSLIVIKEVQNLKKKLYSSKTLLKSGCWGDPYPTFKRLFFEDRKTGGMDDCIIINKFSA